MDINFTLIGDGSSDKMLLPVLKWLLIQHYPNFAINAEYADLRSWAKTKMSLSKRICLAVDLFPCNLLFVHRDAEKESPQNRYDEIRKAIKEATCDLPHNIPVVPVKMSEAWLLFDEQAIRDAAGNPNGRVRLNIPSIRRLEILPDPKKELEKLLKLASGLDKRRLKSFKPRLKIHRIAETIEDYSLLRSLPAFNQLENRIKSISFN